MVRIAISGKSRAGKDTIAGGLFDIFSIIRESVELVSFAKPLYDCMYGVQKGLGQELKKDPRLLQFLGEGLRQLYDRDIFVNSAVKTISQITPNTHVVVTDLRYKNEYNMLKSMGFVTIRVNRKDRPIDRDPTHISETDLDDATFDYVIDNDGTIQYLCDKVVEIVSSIHPHDPLNWAQLVIADSLENK